MARPDAIDVDRVYREHGHVVFRRARAILGSDSEAGEVLQEVFLLLLDRPSSFRGESSVLTFLYGVTTRLCLGRMRKTRRRAALDERELVPRGSLDGAASPELTMEAAQLLARLPERLAQVAIYYFVDEMTHDEIAEILQVSRRQVGNLVNRVQEEARRGARAA